MKKKYPVPKGNIEYKRLKKKTDLIKLCADFYLLYTMKALGAEKAKTEEGFLESRKKFLEDLDEAFSETADELEKLFLAYFPLAVATELQNSEEIKSSDKTIAKLAGDFLDDIPGDHREILGYLEKEVFDCPKALSFFSSAKTVFGKLKWESGYGGKKWADIADTAYMRLSGAIDRVLFIDRAFDIQHHGGHIFDKCDNINYSDEELNAVLIVKSESSLERIKKFTKEYASVYINNLFKRGNVFKWWKEEEKNGEEKK